MQRLVSVALIVAGLGLLMIGLLAGLFYLGLPVVSPDVNYDLLQINTVAVGALAVSGIAGALLAWIGWRRYTGVSSRIAQLPGPWWFVLLFILALGLGEVVLGTRVAPWIFPPLHVLASVAPPLFFLTLAARLIRPSGVTVQRRDLALQVAGGAVFATGLALVIEVISVVLLVLAAALVRGIGRWRWEDSASLFDRSRTIHILRDPI